jgi:hypothetical protein
MFNLLIYYWFILIIIFLYLILFDSTSICNILVLSIINLARYYIIIQMPLKAEIFSKK